MSILRDEVAIAEKHSATFSSLVGHVNSELKISLEKSDLASIAWCCLGLSGTKTHPKDLDEAGEALNAHYSQLFRESRPALDPSVLDRDYLEGLFAGAAAFPSMMFSKLLVQNTELIDFLEKWAYLGSPSLLGEISFLLSRIGNADPISERVELKVRNQIREILPSFESDGISFANMPAVTVRKVVGLIFGLRIPIQLKSRDIETVRKTCPIEDVAKLCLWGLYNKVDDLPIQLITELDDYVDRNLLQTPFSSELVEQIREITSPRSTDANPANRDEVVTQISRGGNRFKVLPTGELVISEIDLERLPTVAPKADSLVLLSLSKGGRSRVLEFPVSDKPKLVQALRLARPGFSAIKTRWFDVVAALFLAGYTALSAVALVLLGIGSWLSQLWQATVLLLDLQIGSFLDQSLRTLPHPVLIGLVAAYLGLYYSTNFLSTIRERGELSSKDLLACFTRIPIVRQVVSFARRFWKPTTVQD